MEFYKKPSADKKKLCIKLIASVLLIAVGLFLVIFSWVELARCRRVMKMALTLDATVVRVEETSANDSDYYNVYVEYVCCGETFETLYISSLHESWLDKVGTQVEIVINPERPTEQLDNIIGQTFFAMFFGLPILFGGIVVTGINTRKTYVQTYGANPETVKKDLIWELLRNMRWLSIPLETLVLFAHGFAMIGLDSIAAGEILLAVMLCLAAVPTCILFIRFYKSWKERYATNERTRSQG